MFNRWLYIRTSAYSSLPSLGTRVSPNDATTGTGNNQFEFVGASWLTGTNASDYNGDFHYTNVTNHYYNVRFSGTQIQVYNVKNTSAGIAAISIDGGAETNVDFYRNPELRNTLVYTSPTLSAGTHTLKVRVTGTKNSSSAGYYITQIEW